MSIDLNWETLTSGPDGDALAERIRTFIHGKFQTVPLPRFIRSVNVHGFDFGTVPPQLELKDITDPLPDFYEQELEDDEEEEDEESEEDVPPSVAGRERLGGGGGGGARGGGLGAGKRDNGLREALRSEMGGVGGVGAVGVGGGGQHDMGRAFLGRSTPGILGGPGRNYFHSHLGTGTQTPLAAVAGAHMGTASWMGSTLGSELLLHTPSHSRNPSQGNISIDNFSGSLDLPLPAVSSSQGGGGLGSEKSDVSTLGPPSRPSTSHAHHLTGSAIADDDDDDDDGEGALPPPHGGRASPRREPRVEDVQAVFRIRYSGDVRLNLTAEILLDYPMPSFVGIPLKLNITGLSFDGVGVLAHIRKRVHFCFLGPEDALAAIGPDDKDDDDAEQQQQQQQQGSQGSGGGNGGSGSQKSNGRFAGLLQEIKVESEIGERESGKQSLKNVGKVERFVLEQVRRIFEEEFVYPSFWTFLV